jgi:acetylornithine deacetylase/succinyl-diaminopimelate desuccinylase-like protein
LFSISSVQPAAKEDGWDTEPFVLTKSGEGLTSGLTGLTSGLEGLKLFGRGSTDDKGPVLGWLHTIEAYQQSGINIVRFSKISS